MNEIKTNLTTRNKKEKLKTAKGRRLSSKLWLERQINDPYVKAAKTQGYRSRAAYKIIEINDKFKIVKKGDNVIDLGATPGGWTQIALKLVGSKGKVIAVDLNEMEQIDGAYFLKGDFLEQKTKEQIRNILNDHFANEMSKLDQTTKLVDVVISDMAASSCGHTQTDHLKIVALCEEAFYFAKEVLKENGNFVAKILRGGTENKLLAEMKRFFKVVKHFKPASSRAESAEIYVIAIGFRQVKND